MRSYLRMAARRDLYNLVRKELRRRCVPLDVVDLPARGNNWEEEVVNRMAMEQTLAIVRKHCSSVEWIIIRLIIEGERDTKVFAEALGLGKLGKAERARRVNRVKDRVKKRLRRRLLSYRKDWSCRKRGPGA